MRKKLILIIGGGKESIPGIIELKRNGYKTLVTDKSNKAPSKKFSNYFIKSSIYNTKSTIKKILVIPNTTGTVIIWWINNFKSGFGNSSIYSYNFLNENYFNYIYSDSKNKHKLNFNALSFIKYL